MAPFNQWIVITGLLSFIQRLYWIICKRNVDAIAGPFSKSPCYQLHSNNFGVIPKLVPGKCRLFTDISFPLCFSVNDLIPDDQFSVKYVGIPEASEKLFVWAMALYWQKLIFEVLTVYYLFVRRTEILLK